MQYPKSLLGLGLCGLALSLAAPTVSAQLNAGESLVGLADTDTNSTAPGQVWVVDHQTGKATQLTIPAALVSQYPNALLLQTPVNGFVGTNVGGNIYGFQYVGGRFGFTNSGNPLNTTASAGNNVAQLVQVGSRLYYTTQGGTAGGVLQSIPVAGGPVTAELDIGTVNAVHLANGVCAIGTTVYVGTFLSGVTNGTTPAPAAEIIAYDTTTNTGKLIYTLASGKRNSGTNNYGIGIVNMAENPAQKGTIVILGVFGEVLVLDPDQANGHANPTLLSHELSGGILANGNAVINLVNSFSYDEGKGEWVVGSRDGHVERIVDGQSAEKIIPGVGAHVGTGTGSFSLSAIAHFSDAKESDQTIGRGCRGQDGWVPTDVSIGSAVSGNSNYEVALFSGNGGETVILALGNSATTYNGAPLPIDLGIAGATGCMLRVAPLILLGASLGGSGTGQGVLRLKAPIPGSLSGVTIYRQWAMDMSTSPTNNAGFVLSNARGTKL